MSKAPGTLGWPFNARIRSVFKGADVRAILAQMTPEQRARAEAFYRSDNFHRHCEATRVAPTWANLINYSLAHNPEAIWSITPDGSSLGPHLPALEAALARDPLIQVRDDLERAIAKAEAARESAEIAQLGDEKPQSAAAARQAEPSGRKPKYDWLEFDAEVVAVAASRDGLPKREQMQAYMVAWCARNWDRQPGASTIRDRLARLYSRLPVQP